MDLSDLNKHIEQIINEHNRRVITDFEGLSNQHTALCRAMQPDAILYERSKCFWTISD